MKVGTAKRWRSAAPSLNRCRRRCARSRPASTGLDEIEIDGLGQGDDHNALRAAIGQPDAPIACSMWRRAMRLGMGVDEIHECSKKSTPWFLERIAEIVAPRRQGARSWLAAGRWQYASG